MKYRGKVIASHLLDAAKDSLEKSKNAKPSQSGRKKAAAKHCLPEGATLELLKLEIQIAFPYQEAEPMRLEIKQTYNVRAIKGFVKASLKDKAKSQMLVSYNGEQLKDSQNIAELDFVQHEFQVKFLAIQNDV